MTKTSLVLSLLTLCALALPSDAGARDPKAPKAPTDPRGYGKFDRAPSRASKKQLDTVRTKARDSRAAAISLATKTSLSVASMKPVPWAFLKFLDSVYVSGHGYADTGYASFAEGKGRAILVTQTDPTQARLVSCGLALQTSQAIVVREVEYGDKIEEGTVVFSQTLGSGNRTASFVALGTAAPKMQYVVEGAGNWNLLYCDVYSMPK